MTVVAGCRACGDPHLAPIMALGPTPLANALLPGDEAGASIDLYPLDLVRCERCSLVQLSQTIAPGLLFSDYPYFSSVSDAIVGHAQAMAETLISSEHLDARSLVVE